MIRRVSTALRSKAQAVAAKVQTFAADKAGSDTTEKIGMVVVAIVIVGLLAVAVKNFMPGIFNSIFGTAEDKLNGIF